MSKTSPSRILQMEARALASAMVSVIAAVLKKGTQGPKAARLVKSLVDPVTADQA